MKTIPAFPVLVVLLGTACQDGAPLCLPLSPECARAQADLRVDVTNLPTGTRLVTAQVNGITRSTGDTSAGAVTFYFFDVPQEAPVAVQVDGADVHHRCQGAAPARGRGGSTLELDVASSACERDEEERDAGVDAPDAAMEEDAGEPDAGDDDPDGGDDDHDEDGGSSGRRDSGRGGDAGGMDEDAGGMDEDAGK